MHVHKSISLQCSLFTIQGINILSSAKAHNKVVKFFVLFCAFLSAGPNCFVMGRLDVSALRYLSKDDLRTLQAVEQGMKNHDIVPVELISSIAALKHGGAYKCLSNLLRNKLIKHDRKRYDGYSLNNLGYDYLAFNTLSKRGVLRAVGRQIGVGKESDVFVALDDTEEKQVGFVLLQV